MQLLIKALLVDFVGDEVRSHNDIVLEVADVANRNVFNNRICELKKYNINTVKVHSHSHHLSVSRICNRRI